MSKARGLADLGNAYSDGALSNRNLIINGAANINQRNAVATSTGAYGPDRFVIISGSGLTASIEQGSVSSGTIPYEKGFRNTIKATNTTTSTATGRYTQIEYRIEGQDLNRSGWNYKSASSQITLSFWAKSSVSGTYSLYMDDSGFANRISSSFALVANTWTKVTKPINGSSIVLFNDDNTRQSRIVFVCSYGTDYTTSGHVDDTWATSNNSSYAPDESHGWNNSASSTFEITGVQLEVGDTATPFEHRSYGDELQRCSRYAHVLKPEQAYGRYRASYSDTGTSCNTFYEFPVEMRSLPTLTSNNMSSSTFQCYSETDGGFYNPTSAFTLGESSKRHVYMACNTATATAGAVGMWRWNNNPSASMVFDAEL